MAHVLRHAPDCQSCLSERGQCVSKIPDLFPAFGDGSAFGDDSFSHSQIEFFVTPLPSQD